MTQLLETQTPIALKDERGSGRNRTLAQIELNAHIEAQASTIAPEDPLLNKYRRIIDRDAFMPTLEELRSIYARVGGVITQNPQNPRFYFMEMPGKALSGTSEALWNWYWERRDMMAIVAAARPLPF